MVWINRGHNEEITASLIWIIGVRVGCRSGVVLAVDKFCYFKRNLYYPSD